MLSDMRLPGGNVTPPDGHTMDLTRRSALGLSIALVAAGLAGETVARNMAGTKVIVIGAGLAGLAAAQQIRARGARVVVLEAGNYVGGRIRTDRSMGAPFEFGAAWIHGPSRRNPVKRLADQVKARTFVADEDNLEIFDPRGNPLPDRAYDRLDNIYARIENTLDRVSSRDTRSVHQLLSDLDPGLLNDPLGRWIASAYIEFEIGTEIKNISAANGFASRAFSGTDVILPQGYDAIVAPMARGLDIRLNTRVARVSITGSSVDVDGMKADYVICAVPLGVLKAGAIAFDPPLPRPLARAINEIGFGSVTKIALKFERPFWDIATQYFGIMTEPKGRWNYWLNYRTFSQQNILMGLSFGGYAPVADRMGKSTMTRDAMAVLRSVWGSAVGAPISVRTTRWSRERDFLGAYSYPQAGGSIAQFRRFEESVSDRLFMAGEHTNFDYHSTTHGALMSGLRAAKAILRA